MVIVIAVVGIGVYVATRPSAKPVSPGRHVSVSISPTSKSGDKGAALTYTATVNNTGTVPDNYTLTVTDDNGWAPSISPTSLLNVSSGGSGTATLSVTIPASAVGGTIDHINVTATCQENTSVSASASCTAQVIFKIAVVSDIGGRGDLAFNDMGFKGGEMAENAFGVKMVELISKSEADYLPNMRAAASDPDVKLIVGVGFLLTDAISTAENEFPDKDFVNIDAAPVAAPNSLSIVFQEQKGSAEVGALATLLAAYYNYPYIGMCLGIEIPVLWHFEIGYKWGCQWAVSWIENNHPELDNSDIIAKTPALKRVLWNYTGTFSDVTKGYDTAKAMYAEGAIAVYNVAGPLGIGINQAVNEIATTKHLTMGPPFWIGVDSDQDWMNPSFCIASCMKRVDLAVYYATQFVVNNTFRDVVQEDNSVLSLGMGTVVKGITIDGVKMSDLNDLNDFIQFGAAAGKLPMPADNIRAAAAALRNAQPSWIWNAVSELDNKIRSGAVTVPYANTENDVTYWRGIVGN